MTQRPHDALFKTAFEAPEDAAALARCHLSASICAAIRWSTMTRESGSFVDAELADRHSDLLFSVETEMGRVLIYLLFEHQSTIHPRMLLRMLIYMVRIWERHDKQQHEGPLPAIIPLLVCHAPGGWTSAKHFQELFAPELGQLPELVEFVPAFSMIVDDLAHVSNDQLKARAMTAFPKLALWLLRDARSAARFKANFPDWAENLEAAARAPTGMEALKVFFRYLSLVNEDLSWNDFRATIHELAPVAEQKIMTLYEQLMIKGRSEGRAEGRFEGRAGLLTRQLGLKFGEIPELHRARLAAASADEIDTWAERVLTATTLDQVFAD